jgi:hypothetical protein
MKLNKFILSLLVLAATQSHAQTLTAQAPEKEYTLGLSVQPLWLLLGGLGANVDRRLTNRTSIGLGGTYIPPRRSLDKSDDRNKTSDTSYKWTYYEVHVGPTFFLTGDYDTSGWYLNPAVGYTGAKITEYSSFNLSGSTDTFAFRTSAGYQWILKNDLRLVFGGGYQFLNQSEVVVKDGSGTEVLREKSSAAAGLVIDAHFGVMF